MEPWQSCVHPIYKRCCAGLWCTEYEQPAFLDQLQTSEESAALGRDTAARVSAHADLMFRRPALLSVPVCPGESQLVLNTLRLLEEMTNDSNFRQVPISAVAVVQHWLI